MTSPIKTTKVCEVVGVLKNEANLENTIDHLLTSGFDQSESKYPPAKPGALCLSRSKRLTGCLRSLH